MSENSKEKKNIVLCMNSAYVMPSTVCITSVLENSARSTESFDFYILYSELHDADIAFMQKCVKKYGQRHSLIPIKVDNSYFAKSPTFGRSKEAYFRLLIPALLPSTIDRCLYLDSDTIVQKPLDNFYSMSFDGKALAVCKDIGEFLFFHKERHALLGIPLEFDYFNSGVLLFNLEYFRDNYNPDTFFKYIESNSEKLKFLDQDVLNALFYDKVTYAYSNLYNYMEILVSPLITNDAIDKAVIVHFLQKPWRFTYNGDNASYWWKYAKKIFKFEYIKFTVLNFLYRKSLGALLLVLPVKQLKKIKNKLKR